MEDVLKGAFVKGFKIKNRKVTGQSFMIKLSEIKLIEEYDEFTVIISTFKDAHYCISISEEELLKAVNLFIFKPEEYGEIYPDWY